MKQSKYKKTFWEMHSTKVYILIAILVIIGLPFMLGKSSDKENQQSQIFGDDVIDLEYFHLSTCPHCHKQNEFHKILLEKYPNLRINTYEMTKRSSAEKLQEISANYPDFDINQFGTPTSFIGEEFNIGYGSDDTTGQKLIEMIEKEQTRINENWNESTMIRSVDLRNQLENTQ